MTPIAELAGLLSSGVSNFVSNAKNGIVKSHFMTATCANYSSPTSGASAARRNAQSSVQIVRCRPWHRRITQPPCILPAMDEVLTLPGNSDHCMECVMQPTHSCGGAWPSY